MSKPKKSIEVLIAEGRSNLTKAEIEQRRKEEAAIRPNDDQIDCPKWLTDETARNEYNRVAVELKQLNLLTNLDITTLAQYCIAYSNYLKASEQLKDQPLVIEQTNKSGFTNMIRNPLISIQLAYADEMRKHASTMGLTISSRLKLVVPEPKNDKPKNKFSDYVDE